MTSIGKQLSNDEKKFLEFMKAKLIFKNDKSEYNKRMTHTLMGPLHPSSDRDGGCLHISGRDYDRFQKLYKNICGKIPLHIIERPNETGNMVGPYIVDIDYKTKTKERVYTSDHIEHIIRICNKIFKKYLNIDKSKLKAYVTEKDVPTYEEKNDNYKDGFHIQYDIPLSVNKRLHFFEIIKADIENQDVFEDIDILNKNYNEIVDESVMISNGLLMFGSQKKNRKPYKLSYIYNHNLEEEPKEDYPDQDELISLFSLQQYTDDDDTEFKEEHGKIEKILNDKKYSKEDRKKKKEQIKKEKMGNSNSNFNSNSNSNFVDIQSKYIPNAWSLKGIPEEYNEVYELIEMLLPKRAGPHKTWAPVGWALYNTSPKLFNLFVHFSKKCPEKFDEEGCYNLWVRAKNDGAGLTKLSLKSWARQDSPGVYKEKIFGKFKELAKKSENSTHDDIANIIYEKYGSQFICSNISKNYWFEFQNHRWVGIDSAYTLHEKIKTEIPKDLVNVKNYFLSNASGDGLEGDDGYKKAKKIIDLCLRLKDQNYSSTLIKACAGKFHDPKFEEALDSNPYLIGFDNGVYDLRTMEFRDGMPEDRISFTTGYDYVEYSKNHKMVEKINNFINLIQPENNMKEYVLRLFSSCLDGKNRDQQFRIFTGHGSNGKSKLIDLLSETLGQYSGTLSPAVLTIKDNNPNGATPFLADKKGKRFLVLQEPEGDSTIQVGKMKGLTGGDKVPARGLFKDPIEYVPQFKMILVCNKLPTIPSNDGGTWRRIRVTQFKSKFLKSSAEVQKAKKAGEKHRYLADMSVDAEKLKEWSPAFMWMLLNIYYVEYIKSEEKGGGLQEPEEVREYTDKYERENDVVSEFLKENYVITNSDKDTEKIGLIFDQFKTWHRENYNNGTKLARKDIENYLEEKKSLVIEKKLVKGIKGIYETDGNCDGE
jgi:Megaviricetes DNA primase